jgi:DNA-binding response OmpR family regulator/two-component sensor histidine kinase
LLTLINQLLDLSKIEAGNMKLSLSEHNLVSFLKSLFFSFESHAASKKITLSFISASDNIPVVFDIDKMEEIFNNLVSNALKFTDIHGEVKVSIQIIDSIHVEIRVENDGQGIPSDQLPYIFDRFYQVDSSITRKHEGTGIGLALAKELVEMHHGTITAESVEGKGAVFIIMLPVGEIKPGDVITEPLTANQDFTPDISHDVQIVNSAVTDIEALKSAEDKEIILIVEDNEDVRAFIREQLEADYMVTEAENGKAGIYKAQETVPDLIITDLMMPEMDGYQFSKEIRRDERTSHIPVIMLTARAGLDDKIEGLETGIDDYITKPFSTKELKTRVKNLINQRKLLRARFSMATIIKPSEVTTAPIDREFLEKTILIIEANFEDRDFSVESLAAEINMSVSQLNRKLNALIDQPAGQLMRSLRLQRAAELLAKKAGTVAQICYQLGFNDQAYFSRAFKKQFGRSPSEYMKG